MVVVEVEVNGGWQWAEEAGVGGLSDVPCSCPLDLTPPPCPSYCPPNQHSATRPYCGSPLRASPPSVLVPPIVFNLSVALGSVLSGGGELVYGGKERVVREARRGSR